MNDILQDLIKSYSENRPRNYEFKFYSNLSVTQPYHRHLEIVSSISNGLSYLQKSHNSHGGFYSKPFKNPECTELAENLNYIHPEKCEQLTNILAVELLGEELCSGEKLNPEILESVKNSIIPECGISTFNLFKLRSDGGLLCDSSSDSSAFSSSKSCLSGASSSSPDLFTQGSVTYTEISDDSGQDSPVSLSPILSIPEEEAEEEEEPTEEDGVDAESFPDDCNTSSLAVSLLLREGILDFHPAASITELILSNTVPNEFTQKSVNPLGASSEKYPGVIRSFLNCQGIDPVTCANALYLFYLTDMDLNYEENVESTQNYLVQTLNRLLTLEGSVSESEMAAGGGGGNKTALSSDEGDQDEMIGDASEESEAVQLVHHSPDALIFFLSRVTSISTHAKDVFQQFLIALLDHRIGLPSGPLDLAMRLLAADELNLLTHEVDSKIRNSISKDYEALLALQDDHDGSWPEDSLISIIRNSTSKTLKQQIFFGSKELSTIFACKALDVYYESMKCVKSKEKLLKDYLY